jgi:hypothetical protein
VNPQPFKPGDEVVYRATRRLCTCRTVAPLGIVAVAPNRDAIVGHASDFDPAPPPGGFAIAYDNGTHEVADAARVAVRFAMADALPCGFKVLYRPTDPAADQMLRVMVGTPKPYTPNGEVPPISYAWSNLIAGGVVVGTVDWIDH